MSVYLDCNATTPIEPEVLDVVVRYLKDDYGNAGSRTHEFGARAKKAVERARCAVASVVSAEPEEVIFTSGATESNNIALLGLANEGRRTGRMHLVSTAIEHKAVLEPLEHLAKSGFRLTLIPPTAGGYVDPTALADAVQRDTLLVSVMHVNNETGVLQPIAEICDRLKALDVYFHVDAAQGFGKELGLLKNSRVDLISLSGHKIYAPKGIGALIARRRGNKRLPLESLFFGGGQERGLRPGTLPVHLAVGLGEAAAISVRDHDIRQQRCAKIKANLLAALQGHFYQFNGDQTRTMSTTVNISFPGVDSEAGMVALKGLLAISNGSACTSSSYQPSHVLSSMALSKECIDSAMRFSWCHLTPDPPWTEAIARIQSLL